MNKNRIFNILTVAAMAGILYSCQVKMAPIVINPDPVFDQTGLYEVNTISIYDDQEAVINVSRVYGLSKEVELTIGINEALLEEYNSLNGTEFELMPEQYYSLPSTIRLDAHVKDVDLPVVFHPKSLAEQVGLEQANNYAIPVSVVSSSIELDEEATSTDVIILPNIVDPELTVIIPENDAQLNFIKGVALSQTVTLTSEVNFTTVDPTKVTYEADASAVEEYNTAHETDYTLLDPKYYTVNQGTFDEENMQWSTDITFTCHEMPDDNTYLLPLVMKSEDYDVSQRSVIYILAKLNILQMWVADEGSVITSNTGKGTVTVELNAPITDEQPADFTVDNDKVDEYNSANGTSYLTIDPSKVTVTPTVISAGELSAEVSYEIDIKDMEYDSEDKYLVPLVLSRNGLYTGTEVLGDVIYVSPNKTLEIEYTKEVWGEEISDRQTAPKVLHSGLLPSKNEADQQYAINYNQKWDGGLLYFNILDETMDGYPNRRLLGDFQDRPNDKPEGQDPLKENGPSWIDMETGVLHFDIIIMDMTYASQGGFPIQVNLIPAE